MVVTKAGCPAALSRYSCPVVSSRMFVLSDVRLFLDSGVGVGEPSGLRGERQRYQRHPRQPSRLEVANRLPVGVSQCGRRVRAMRPFGVEKCERGMGMWASSVPVRLFSKDDGIHVETEATAAAVAATACFNI